MFDTMTMTKIIGGLCGTFLIFLLGNWAAGSIYGTGEESHSADEHAMAYPIEVDEAGGDQEAAADSGPDFATLMASADAASGEKVFSKCKSCHKAEAGANSTGPYLYGVVGRDVGTASGFSYSSTVAGLGGQWTPDRLFEFLENPKGYAPGTKMTFAGLKKPEDRANVIAYLESLGG